MVDIADVPKITALTSEVRNLRRAVANLSAAGRIDMVRISPGPDQDRGMPVTVPTTDWDYPAQMVAAILDKCRTRLDEAEQELQAAGVTGVEARS